MFNRKELSRIKESIELNSTDIKKLYQMFNKLNKENDIFIEALNEQRVKISQSIYVIQYICKKLNIKLSEPKEKSNKTTKKGN